jgi:hypothetical protein
LDYWQTYICDSAHSLIVDDGVLLHFLHTLVKDLSNKNLDVGVLRGLEQYAGTMGTMAVTIRARSCQRLATVFGGAQPSSTLFYSTVVDMLGIISGNMRPSV